jgi:MFS family permease
LMRIPTSLRMEGSNFVAELADGWREFSSRPWLWAIVLQFGFVNAVELGTEFVLGPAIAKDHFGGAAAWGLILTAQSLGLVAGGVALLRLRPRRILLAATLGFLLTVPFLLALAVPIPLAGVVVAAGLAGIGLEVFQVLWETAMQQEIPQEKLSRVSSYDALGSFVLIPLGFAVAGPVAELIGTRPTVLGAATISLTATLAVLFVRDVRTIARREDSDSSVLAPV